MLNMFEQQLAEISRRKVLLVSAGMMAAVALPGSPGAQTAASPHQPINLQENYPMNSITTKDCVEIFYKGHTGCRRSLWACRMSAAGKSRPWHLPHERSVTFGT